MYVATYHVQDFAISNATSNGDIIITCIFAIGSNATGCRVDLANNDYQWNITTTIHKNDSSSITATCTVLLPIGGSYTAAVYDIVDSTVSASDEPAIIYSNILIAANFGMTSTCVSVNATCKL